nr:MAG TPA: hypothetical protein [Caudoviricetes sp.]DAY90224.1 MAG TPA: hypothetical protein [Caudoviricetes sp.]
MRMEAGRLLFLVVKSTHSEIDICAVYGIEFTG